MLRRTAAAGADGARLLDASDELAPLRREFVVPRRRGRAVTYLCGHSLGLMPRHARRDIDRELTRWAERGVAGHFPDRRDAGWLDYHTRFSERLAALTGAKRGEVVAMNTLTVNLHLMLVSFYRPTKQRCRILIERGAFPSDRYAVASQLRFHGYDPARDLVELGPGDGGGVLILEDFRAVLEQQGERIALVLLPGVQFLTGQRLDVAAFTKLARSYGCRVGFDLAHAIGNVPLALHEAGPDFAVWCSYKYLNAGPGAVGGCFVHERAAADADLPRFAGWWGHDAERRFAMPHEFAAMHGAQGWQLSNPPIFSLAPLASSLELFERAGPAKLRRKSVRLTRFLETELIRTLGERVAILTPSDPDARGCQLSLRLKSLRGSPRELVEKLERNGVVADLREPDVLRLAPVPLYNRFRDVHAAVQKLAAGLER